MKRLAGLVALLIMFSLSFAYAQGEEFFDAVKKQKIKKIEKLLKEKPGLVNLKDKNGDTALYICIGDWNKREIAKLLLEHGADPNATNKYGWTPFFALAFDSNPELLKLMLEKGGDVNFVSVRRYFDQEKNIEKVVEYPILGRVVGNCEIDILKLFLEKGADVHQGEESGMSCLRNVGLDVEKLKVILEYGADINTRILENRTILMNAVSQKDSKTKLEELEKNSAFIKYVIKNGADISARDDLDWTALHYAIWYNNLPALEMLLEAGADPKVRSPILSSPLKFAQKMERTEMIKLLEAAAKRSIN